MTKLVAQILELIRNLIHIFVYIEERNGNVTLEFTDDGKLTESRDSSSFRSAAQIQRRSEKQQNVHF